MTHKHKNKDLNREAAVQRCLRKKYSENMQQIYRKIPVSKCNFNNVALQLY